ncbi:glycosyltransferase family A protein [Christiangramia sediminis]|uniref:Glycosyltransferase family 2 protein n=1 Tax=Christiangramia sediminis TaxID=2881336 RepID=A0A9X1RXU8_9FLAO|nr:glycosyltransferase family A protein [Christiangramia sediminis]MCB7481327.1 glycosyltransferase family 2 protein [Christiangramia sediminis]
MNTPLVSIIVPCYNQAKYLDDALESVLNQKYSNWECIIVNDGSSDKTEIIAAKWLKKDDRFQYLFQKNAGLSTARNNGIEKASGEYILPLDADDMVSSDYINSAVKSFMEDPELKLVYPEVEKFGEETGLLSVPDFSRITLARQNMIICSALFKKNEWKKVGGYDPNLIYGLEDWEFWIAILQNGGNVKKLQIRGIYYRIKKISMSKAITAEEILWTENYVLKKHPRFFISNYNAIVQELQDLEYLLKSEKFLLNCLFKRILNFTFFK